MGVALECWGVTVAGDWGGIVWDPTSAARKAPGGGMSGRRTVCRATLDKQAAMRAVLKLAEEVAVCRILGP